MDKVVDEGEALIIIHFVPLKTSFLSELAKATFCLRHACLTLICFTSG